LKKGTFSILFGTDIAECAIGGRSGQAGIMARDGGDGQRVDRAASHGVDRRIERDF